MAHKLDRTYGRWEFRARTDKGRGFGSAILLWPESERFPEDGEIDIMEVPSETRDRAHFIVHFPGPGGSDKVYGSYAEDDFSEWHTFAVDWLPDRIVYYVDGVERFRVTDRNIIPDKPMHLAMQFDQGPKKDWIPAPGRDHSSGVLPAGRLVARLRAASRPALMQCRVRGTVGPLR